MWESYRIDSFSNDKLLYVLKKDVLAQWGGGHEVMLMGWGIFSQ